MAEVEGHSHPRMVPIGSGCFSSLISLTIEFIICIIVFVIFLNLTVLIKNEPQYVFLVLELFL